MSSVISVVMPAISAIADAKNTDTSVSIEEENFSSQLDRISQANEAILKKREQKAAQDALMKQRIAEVGLAQYINEQKEVQRMMRVLKILENESSGDVKEHMQRINETFEQKPAATVQVMNERINDYISGLPAGTADHISERLKDLLKQARALMLLPDELLQKAEKESEQTAKTIA